MSIRPHNASQVKLTQEQMYDIIREPIVTEKSTLGSQFGQVTFKVGLLATKPEIKVAVEQLFDRKVKAVNTLRQKGKVKRFRGRLGRRSDFKKAVEIFGSDGDLPPGIAEQIGSRIGKALDKNFIDKRRPPPGVGT